MTFRRQRLIAILIGADQEPRSGGRRERNRDLQLGIITPAGALIGVGPAAVEHVFALRVGLQIAGYDAEDLVASFRDQMARRPAGAQGG